MNSNSVTRQIHISGVGGPFLETTEGIQSDSTFILTGQIRSAVLLSIVMLSTGSILGWIGHATLIR